jgi:hypothetical protein
MQSGWVAARSDQTLASVSFSIVAPETLIADAENGEH